MKPNFVLSQSFTFTRALNDIVRRIYFSLIEFYVMCSERFQKGDIWLVDRVLVIGGAGFVGSHLVDRLVSEGFDVVVLDDFSSGRRESLSQHFGKDNFCLVEGDVRDGADVKKALEGVDFSEIMKSGKMKKVCFSMGRF